MRKPTEKQFRKKHPDLEGQHVSIHKHHSGNIYVKIIKDLEFDGKGRVTKAVETCYFLNEALELARPWGKEITHIHTYKTVQPGEFVGCSTAYGLSNATTTHNHTVLEETERMAA